MIDPACTLLLPTNQPQTVIQGLRLFCIGIRNLATS